MAKSCGSIFEVSEIRQLYWECGTVILVSLDEPTVDVPDGKQPP